MKTFFTSDTHFFHKKAIEFRGLQGKQTVEQMNDALVEAWNSVVSNGDLVYHLGDVSFGKPKDTLDLLWRLNGDIVLIQGNHDGKRMEAMRPRFIAMVDYHKTHIGEYDIVLFHFPILQWDKAHHGSLHFHGHSHGNMNYPDPKARILDVGVDSVGYKPIELSTALAVMKELGRTEYKGFDHHNEGNPG